MWVGEGATKLALGAWEVRGAGTGVYRGSREARANRQGEPWVRQVMATQAPSIPKAGQQIRGEQGEVAEQRLRGQVCGVTAGPALVTRGPSMDLECQGLVEGKWVWEAPQWPGWGRLVRRWMPGVTG